MRFKTDIVLAAGCACLLSLSIPAFGRPLPRDLEQAPRAARHDARIVPLPPRRPAPQVTSRPPMSTVQRVAVASTSMIGGSALVAEARKYLGTNPTDRKRLWCATFMNFILAKLGYAGTNSDAAKSFAYYGRRISAPQVGAIAVLTRGRRGGHVGVVSGIDANGNPIIISGNHNRRVGIGVYPRSRVITYVMPTQRHAAPTRLAERGPSEPGLDSPITELLAVINAETDRAEARASAREATRPPQRPAMRPPEMRPPERPAQPYRLVQQMPN